MTMEPKYQVDVDEYLATLPPKERAALKEIDDLLKGKVEQRIRPITKPKDDAHKLTPADRRARRVKNKVKRQKRLHSPAGREAWMPKAKAKQRSKEG